MSKRYPTKHFFVTPDLRVQQWPDGLCPSLTPVTAATPCRSRHAQKYLRYYQLSILLQCPICDTPFSGFQGFYHPQMSRSSTGVLFEQRELCVPSTHLFTELFPHNSPAKLNDRTYGSTCPEFHPSRRTILARNTTD